MKTTKFGLKSLWVLGLATLAGFSSCTKNEETRAWEPVKIASAYINGAIASNVTSDESEAIIPFAAGTDISNMKVKLVVVNGKAVDFPDDTYMDCRKPIAVKLQSNTGKTVDYTLKVTSAPKLTDFIIEGLSISEEKTFITADKIVAQVPVGTDLTKLKVTLNFLNGTLVGFQNGVEKDYTNPVSFSVLGVDETTSYPYQLMLTDQEVGPAAITDLKFNDESVASFTTSTVGDKTYVRTNISAFTDLSKVKLNITTGYGNTIENFVNGSEINLLNSPEIDITGTNGILTKFVFNVPQIIPNLLWSKDKTAILRTAFAVVGDKFVTCTGSGIVLNVYNTADASLVKSLDQTGIDKTGISGIVRKVTSDTAGNLLVMDMAHTSKTLVVWRWKSVDATPTTYIKYTDESVANVRSAGINITGSLDGDAVIMIALSKTTRVLKYTVKGGVLNSTPEILEAPETNSFFAAYEQLPSSTNVIGGSMNGGTAYYIGLLNKTFSTITRKTVMAGVSDVRAIKYKGRTLVAYVAVNAQGGNKDKYKVCDVTDENENSLDKEIFVYNATMAVSPGNGTTDADFAMINGKLHVIFTVEGKYIECFSLE
ncbi:MAG: hypothetical protein PHD21_00790 [Flavobacteriales bacterium]|nr:hypothetical protein [Flavobacteriales bacterium]